MYTREFEDFNVLKKYVELRDKETFYVSKKLSGLEIKILKEYKHVK